MQKDYYNLVSKWIFLSHKALLFKEIDINSLKMTTTIHLLKFMFPFTLKCYLIQICTYNVISSSSNIYIVLLDNIISFSSLWINVSERACSNRKDLLAWNNIYFLFYSSGINFVNLTYNHTTNFRFVPDSCCLE